MSGFARRIECVVIMILTSALSLPLNAIPQNEKTNVLLQIRMKTAYDDSEESVHLLSRLIKYLPVREVELPDRGTLSEIILKNYRISKYNQEAVSYMPRSFELLEESILSLNDAGKPEELRAGSILIPYVPKKAIKNFNPDKSLNLVPRISVFRSESIRDLPEREDIGYRYEGQPELLDRDRAATQFELLDLEIPLDLVKEIMSDEILSENSTLFNLPIEIKLGCSADAGAADPTEDHQVLHQTEQAYVRKLIGTEMNRSVPLFIIDTGWPDPQNYTESRRRVREILDFIWSRIFSKTRTSHSAADKDFTPPCHPHCRHIARSLEEFRDLDPNNKVPIIYIPTAREQDASPILEEIIQTHYILRVLNQNPIDHVTDDIIKNAKKNARKIVKDSFPSKWGDGPVLKTDKVIVEAVLSIASVYSREKKSIFCLNESWTTTENFLPVFIPSDMPGIVCAAAGNINEDFLKNHRDFAQRCLNHRDTIAVLNMDFTGLQCSSNKFDFSLVDDANVLGFDGLLNSEEDLCGTSFAAPRVAWLIALSEAAREEDPPDYGFCTDLCKRLKKIRPMLLRDMYKTLFYPLAFLNRSINNGFHGGMK